MSGEQRRIDEGLQEIREVWECQRLMGIVAEYIEAHHHLWRIGDNAGGAVRLWMEHEFSKRGLIDNEPEPIKPKRKKLSVSRTIAVFRHDGFRCVHCGSEESLTIDHIYPVTRGGTDEDENLQTLCQSCNSSKGSKVYD